mmetsp:Transcript_14027/g.36254  ORF Transcript_14027/g.36254 Transcript_14027/m.36254 type:complete len:121 (+) Transcript_14027:209-571(+)
MQESPQESPTHADVQRLCFHTFRTFTHSKMAAGWLHRSRLISLTRTTIQPSLGNCQLSETRISRGCGQSPFCSTVYTVQPSDFCCPSTHHRRTIASGMMYWHQMSKMAPPSEPNAGWRLR